ncbi:MAG: replicative DNA helicase [Planctomycetes bacterium]|nr:replicative DNA helicase [Planctomycetota bacterium]
MSGVSSPEKVGAELGKGALPASADAERAVLASVLIDNECLSSVVVHLDHADYFYYAANREIYQAMLGLDSRSQPIDLVLLTEELEGRGTLAQAGGLEYLARLVDECPNAANAEYYAGIVRDRFVQRRLIDASREILEECHREGAEVDALVDRAEQRIFEIGEHREVSNVASMREALREAFRAIDGRSDRLTGLETGFYDLDELTSGLQNSELIILAARPSMGKTSMAMNIVEHAAVDLRKPVAVFSLEVGRVQLVQNLLCSRARVDAHKVRRGKLEKELYQKLTLAAGELEDAPIHVIDEAGTNLMRVRALARRLKKRHGIALIVIDYLQLMEGPPGLSGRPESRQQDISYISRGLKGLARELDIPVLALSQLNRESDRREDHRPRLADLRESGALEQDADVVMMLYREEYYFPDRVDSRGQAELLLAKQRHGPLGTVPLTFLKECVRFESRAQPWNEVGP